MRLGIGLCVIADLDNADLKISTYAGRRVFAAVRSSRARGKGKDKHNSKKQRHDLF